MRNKYWAFINFWGGSSDEEEPEPDTLDDFITRVENDGGTIENESGLATIINELKTIN